MKTRILVVIAACAIAGGLGWYLNPFAPATPDEPAATPAPAVKAPAPVALKPAGIQAPKIAPTAVAAPRVAAVPAANVVSSPAAESSDPQPKADLKECITQTIKLLEAKDVAALIKTLMPPSAVQQMIASGQANSIDDIVAKFSQRPDINEKMAQLQQALESVKDLSPEMSVDGLQATYKVDPSVPNAKGNGDMTFIQIDGNWYLK